MRIGEEAADGVLRVRTLMVNVYLVRNGSSWVLVDAGLRGYARTIIAAAEEFVGSDRAPEAIVLTHGHFDHIGSLEALLERWPVPVYAHRLERPYLNGESAYPPPDPLVGRGSHWRCRPRVVATRHANRGPRGSAARARHRATG